MKLIKTWQNPYLSPVQNMVADIIILNKLQMPLSKLEPYNKTYVHKIKILGDKESEIKQTVSGLRYKI